MMKLNVQIMKEKMKIIFLFILSIFFYKYTHAQTIGSQVSIVAVDGKTYSGIVMEIQGDNYKVKYDGYDFEAWLTSSQFTVTNNKSQPQTTQQNNAHNNLNITGESWQRQYNIGDKVELKINDAMWQKCEVVENPVGGLLRVNCEEYISGKDTRAGGVYIVYNKEDIHPLKKQQELTRAQFKVGDKIEAMDKGKWFNATILETKGNGYLVHWEGYSSTYDAIISAEKVRNKTGSAINEADSGSPKMSGALPNLPGTWWALQSRGKPGATKEFSTPPTMDFCKSGKWTLGLYGGTNEGGQYQISGNRIIFKYEDGRIWGDYKMKWDAATGVLEFSSSDYIIRLVYKNKLNNC
ncbi:MAG: hypothetical protein WKF35_11465 [Ferruginibacter sp.]